MSRYPENSEVRYPGQTVPPTAPPETPVNDSYDGPAMTMTMPMDSRPTSIPPPPYASLPPQPSSAYNVHQTDGQTVPEPQVVYVVRPPVIQSQKRSGCGSTGRLCMWRIIGAVVVIIIGSVIIAVVTTAANATTREVQYTYEIQPNHRD